MTISKAVRTLAVAAFTLPLVLNLPAMAAGSHGHGDESHAGMPGKKSNVTRTINVVMYDKVSAMSAYPWRLAGSAEHGVGRRIFRDQS